MFRRESNSLRKRFGQSLVVCLLGALLLPLFAVSAFGAGSNAGEIKKLQGIATEIEALKSTTDDPYAVAGLDNAKSEVEAAIAALNANPPDNAGAIQHKKKAAGMCVAVISKCLDTSKVIEDLMKALQNEKGISAAAASEVNSLVQALLKMKKAGVFNPNDPAAFLGRLAFQNTEAALYEIIFGQGDDGYNEKRLCFTWLVHTTTECWDPRGIIDEVLDAMIKEGIISAKQRALIKKKIDAMVAAKVAGASSEELVARDQEICAMIWRPDQTPPESRILTPPAGTALSGVVHLTAEQTNGSDGMLVKWQLTSTAGKKYIGHAENVQSFFDVTFDTAPVPDGDYMLECWMYDDSANFSITRQAVTIDNEYNNLPPIAGLVVAPDSALCGETITFDGSSSHHTVPERKIVKYEWDFDYDGTTDYEETSLSFPDGAFDGVTVRTFNTPGSQFAILWVTDDNVPAKMDSVIVPFTVLSSAPSITSMVATPNSVVEGDTVTIDIEFFNADETDSHTAVIDWGDGTLSESVAVNEAPAPGGGTVGEVKAEHAYGDEGSGGYTVTVTVEDDDGASGADIVLITVTNAPPVLGEGPVATVDTGEEYVINWMFTDPGFLDTHTAVIDWGDGTPLEPMSIIEGGGLGTCTAGHVYAIAGGFPVIITVDDGDGGSCANISHVTVYDNRPFAVIKIDPLEPMMGQEVTFDGTGSYHGRPDRHIVSYEWLFSDGATAVGPVVFRSFSAVGLHYAQLTVTDDNAQKKTNVVESFFDVW